jgi:chemotaxis family two-component system sensor kinase Cph1
MSIPIPAFVSPCTPIDLTNCDREPIHIPGAIQPHGVLLALRERDGVVVQASANASARLATKRPVLGASPADVLGAAGAAEVRDALGRAAARVSVTLDVNGVPHDVTVHRADGLAIVELEVADGAATISPDAFRDTIRETLGHMEHATSVADLANSIATQMRGVTGFDRVWVYRFHEDWHGEIIGESRRDGIEPWLGLHYPASDIPAQARALFLKNWLRMIPDVAFQRVPLEPIDNPETGQPLDLGNSVLRSVSPIHIEYLTNMGVTASLVISLIHRGRLWGLISGHHYSGPKTVPLPTRTLCEFLAQALSLQVGMAERVEDNQRELAIRDVERTLRERLADVEGYVQALVRGTPTLLDLTRSTGAAICDGDVCATVGEVPSSPDVAALARWLRERGDGVFQTSTLAGHYPPAEEWKSFASGLLAVALSPKRPHYILWFRPERRQTIRWAGDPTKAAKLSSNPGEPPRLSPRGSFAAWEQEHRGTAEPWDAVELDAATDLRRTILDILLARAEEVAAINAELEVTNQTLTDAALELETQAEELMQQRAEREALLDRERDARNEAEKANRAKSDFLAMMSHELRTPLNAIGGYAQMLEMGVRGPVSDEQTLDLQRIQRSQRHLLSLINDILNFAKLEAGHIAFAIIDYDLRSALEEVESLVLPQLEERHLTFSLSVDAGPLMVKADGEKVRQVLLNLLSNAIKFTPESGAIGVSAARHGATIVVAVRDTGVGIPADSLQKVFEPFVQAHRTPDLSGHRGIGLGLAISRDLARAMGGDITVESAVGQGSTFTLTLPAAG